MPAGATVEVLGQPWLLEGIDVEVLRIGPEIQQALARGEVDAGGQQDQVLHALGVESRENGAHGATHAIP